MILVNAAVGERRRFFKRDLWRVAEHGIHARFSRRKERGENVRADVHRVIARSFISRDEPHRKLRLCVGLSRVESEQRDSRINEGARL